MPKYTPAIEKLKVKKVVKSLLKNELNSAAVARERGTTRQNESKKARRAPVKKNLIALANKMGLSDTRLIKKHKQLLDAKKLQTCDIYIQDNNGVMKMNKNSNDFIEVDDNQAQGNALKLAYQIKGHLKENVVVETKTILTAEKKEEILAGIRAAVNAGLI